MTSQINDIKNKVITLGQRINAPNSLVVISNISPQNGKPHVEITNGEYRYVTEERGVVFDEKRTACLDELFYWIFRDVTAQMAQDYECENRKNDQDFRRIMFDKQLELLGGLSAKWRLWRKQEIEETLARNPFVDISTDSPSKG